MQFLPNILYGILAILGVSLLVTIHEFGHYIVARAFGMRVQVFSIGFGKTIAEWRPRGSETKFQIGRVPILAYVRVAGMDPREPCDPNDRGCYMNAPPLARFCMIAAGPLANYLAAMIIVFGLFFVGGEPTAMRPIIDNVYPNSPALAGGMRPGDRVVRINDRPITRWQELTRTVSESQGARLDFVVARGDGTATLPITPQMNRTHNRYVIGVECRTEYAPVSARVAAERALFLPVDTSVENIRVLSRMIRGREKVQVMSPVGIVYETAREANRGWRYAVHLLWVISLGLFVLNLLPVPALDGGRLVFLAYEMIMRRRPPPNFEYGAVTASMVLLLGFSAVIMAKDFFRIAADIWAKIVS